VAVTFECREDIQERHLEATRTECSAPLLDSGLRRNDELGTVTSFGR